MNKETNIIRQFISPLLAKWYIRIFTFLLLALICFPLFSKLDDVMGFAFGYMMCCLIPSVLIESMRKSSSPLLFGLTFTRRMPLHFLSGFLLAALNILLLGISAYLMSGKIVFSTPPTDLVLKLALYTFYLAAFEELLFHGEIFQSIQEKFGNVLTVILMSVVFALAHLPNEFMNGLFFLNLILGGILFALMLIKTNSLWLGISFHFFWNFFLYVFLASPVSGFQSDLSYVDVGIVFLPETLFGGTIGVEGGIITTIILLLNCYFVIRFMKPSPNVSAKLFKRYYAESELIYSEDKTKK